MPSFSQKMVPRFKVLVADAEKEMQDRVKNAAGFVGGEIGRRFNGDDNQPENGGDPRFQDFALMRIQDCGRMAKSPSSCTKRDKDGAHRIELFDGIVGGLASDHHVVHVALA